jgi:hypothetical protein
MSDLMVHALDDLFEVMGDEDFAMLRDSIARLGVAKPVLVVVALMKLADIFWCRTRAVEEFKIPIDVEQWVGDGYTLRGRLGILFDEHIPYPEINSIETVIGMYLANDAGVPYVIPLIGIFDAFGLGFAERKSWVR